MRNLASFLLCSTLALAATTATAADAGSGFIENPPALAADEDRAGGSVWRKPGVDLRAYDKVALDQVQVFLDPDSPTRPSRRRT